MDQAGRPTQGPVVLGINTAHDASACLLVGGLPLVAIAEERLSRRKHQAGPPRRAIEYCLDEAGLGSLDEIECIVVNQLHFWDFGAELRRDGFEGELHVNPSHHLLHAYYAAAASGWEESAILVTDGSGYSYAEHARRGSPLLGEPPAFADMEEAESAFALRDGELELVERRWGLWRSQLPYLRFDSLGHMFSAASQYVFGDWIHAGKTMGLAPYGDPAGIAPQIVDYGPDGLSIDTEWILDLPPRSDKPAHLDQVCRNVAAKVQVELEQALLYLSERLHEATGLSHMCLSGGVALNSVANARLRREGPFEEMFVTPAAGDAGVAVGAAIYGHRQLAGELPRWDSYSDFLGMSYGPKRGEAVLASAGGCFWPSRPADHAADAADELVAGRIVGWFEGAGELGPRALGHRSIVCDPRGDSIRDELNEWVKFREPFRPYAASVLEEEASVYFEIDWLDDFMLSVVRIRPEYQDLLPSICHVDGTCRIQTVPPRAGDYRKLIEGFAKRTGLPAVLNTSLNVRGEPIVETPEDALTCFAATNIDLLYLEGWRVDKAVLDPDAVDEGLIPRPTEGLAIERRAAWGGGDWAEGSSKARTRTGYRAPLSAFEATVLGRVDGRASVGEIGGDRSLGARRDVIEALVALQRRGLISTMRPA